MFNMPIHEQKKVHIEFDGINDPETVIIINKMIAMKGMW